MIYAQPFSGANGWPGMVFPIRKRSRGQPSLASTFAVKRKRSSGFLNVDLDVESSGSLKALVDGMGGAIIVLHSGRWRGRHFLRLESARETGTPDRVLRDLCRAVERLTDHGRKVWDRAKRKEFNVGYDLRAGVRAIEVALLPGTVKRLAALGAGVGFTCYRGDDSEQPCASQPPSRGGSKPVR